MNSVKCPIRFCGGRVEHHIVDGVRREWCPVCARRRQGICRDCPRRVYGATGKAIRCAPCAFQRVRTLRAAWEQRDEVRLRRNQWTRDVYAQRPEVKARKKRQHATWVKANPDKVQQYKRAFLLREGPARQHYLAYQTAQNRKPERATGKRLRAREKYYERNPTRPDPHCRDCGTPIPWQGVGRPRLRCDACCSPAMRRRRGRLTSKSS